MFTQRVSIEEKRIDVVKNQPKPKLIQNILIFIVFANFYQYFIYGFSKIAILFTFILKTSVKVNKLSLNKIKVDNNFLIFNARQAFT